MRRIFAVNNFIIKAFRKGRMHFGTPIRKEEIPPPYRELRVSFMLLAKNKIVIHKVRKKSMRKI